MNKRILAVLFGILPGFYGLNAQELHIVTTGDVHGAYFNKPYVGGKYRPSLMSRPPVTSGVK